MTTQLVDRSVDVFVIDTTDDDHATKLVDELRSHGLSVERAFDGRSMKSQMKVADKSGARFALLIGPQEQVAGQVTIRDLRSADHEQAQSQVARGDVVATVSNLLTK